MLRGGESMMTNCFGSFWEWFDFPTVYIEQYFSDCLTRNLCNLTPNQRLWLNKVCPMFRISTDFRKHMHQICM